MRLTRQRGVTLIELMIALALGLVVIYFIFNIMLTSSRIAQQTDGLAQAQENGRFILNWLQSNVRKAGFPVPNESSQSRIQPFANLCSAGAPLPPQPDADCSFNTDTGSESDRLAVRRTYIAPTPGEAVRSESQDCAGVLINSVPDGEAITDVFWLAKNQDTAAGGTGDDHNSIWCASYYNRLIINDKQAIASGIDAMQVLYGLDSSLNNDSAVTRYVSAAEISGSQWDNVRAVRLAILTRSFNDTALDKQTRSYILLDASPVTFNDRNARHIQSTTINLPNR